MDMSENEKVQKSRSTAVSSESQIAQMKKIVYQTIIIALIGAILMILTIGASITSSNVSEEEILAVQYTNQYRLGSKTLTYAVQAYSVTCDQRYYDDYMNELEKDKNRDIAWEGLEKLNIKDSEWAYLKEISELSNGLVPLEVEAIEAAGSGDSVKATSYVFGQEYGDTVEKINSLSDQALDAIQGRMSSQLHRIKIQQFAFMSLLAAALIILILQIIRIITFSRIQLLHPIILVEEQMIELSKGNLHAEFNMEENGSEVGKMVSAIKLMKKQLIGMIEEISDVLAQMGQGNYNITISKEYNGDFNEIKESLLKIKDEMVNTIITIREVTNEVDHGAAQLASAAGDLAEGGTNQANSVSELMSLVQKMSDDMKGNAKEAVESVALAENAGKTLFVGNEKMQELKTAISEINSCSEQIISIVNAIEDIATQTNLLSLNAAIEAARAGEAGKGFAVVADQVKTLAEESASAARKTTELIETTIRAVEKGIEIADDTAGSIEEVMGSAKEATDKMGQISMLLDTSVEGMDKINSVIHHVSQIVDSNSAASQETAAVSEEQKAQVDTMVDLIDRFSI